MSPDKNQSPEKDQMPTKASDSRLEERIHQIAAAFEYPAAPDLASRERARLATQSGKRHAHPRQSMRPGWALAVLVLLLALLTVSPVRARVLEWLRLGAVRIFLIEPAPTPTLAITPNGTIPPTAVATPSALSSGNAGLAGETTLSEAAKQAGFTLKLPAEPTNLGLPQKVYAQQIRDNAVVILVWQKNEQSGTPGLALYEIKSTDFLFDKQHVRNVVETTVNGQFAFWAQGPYELITNDGNTSLSRVVEGRTLIWTENGLTFRLETDLSLEEARRIAESLEPWEP